MGFQFVHFESYARSGGASGRSVDFVLGEAERRPDASVHVPMPAAPEVVFGMSVAEVRVVHDERVADARDVMANGRSRSVRVTQKTLATVVASHPATMTEVRADPATAAAVADWERRTVTWLREVYGDRLVSVIRHIDETHAHLHAYILPDDLQMKVTAMHPGHVAKASVMSAGPLDGEDSKAMNKVRTRAAEDPEGAYDRPRDVCGDPAHGNLLDRPAHAPGFFSGSSSRDTYAADACVTSCSSVVAVFAAVATV